MALVWAPQVRAQGVVCGPYKDMTGSISGAAYGETLGGFGIVVTAGWRLELWYADHDRRSWSILAVQTSGNTCLISQGVSWEHVLPGKHARISWLPMDQFAWRPEPWLWRNGDGKR